MILQLWGSQPIFDKQHHCLCLLLFCVPAWSITFMLPWTKNIASTRLTALFLSCRAGALLRTPSTVATGTEQQDRKGRYRAKSSPLPHAACHYWWDTEQ